MSHRRPRRNVNDLERHKFNAHGDIQVHPGFAAADSSGRFRVTEPFAIFDSHQVTTDDEDAWEQLVVGGGSSVTYVQQRSSTTLECGTGVGDRVVRQSRLYIPAVPGRSNLLMATGVLGDAVVGVKKRIGYFDDNDGMFFELDGDGTFYVVIRSSASGSVVDSRIAQEDWNVDKLDGFSLTGGELDIDGPQVFMLDFQGLGVGTVRFGFEYDGLTHYVHAQESAGHDAVEGAGAFMKTFILPVRYEVYNVDGGNTASLEQITSSFSSEGGYSNVGLEYVASNGIAKRSISARTPILAVRLSSLLNGEVNRKHAEYVEHTVYASGNDVYWEMVHVEDPTVVTGTFGAVSASSAVEASTDVTACSGADDHLVRAGYSTAAGGQRGGTGTSPSHQSRHTVINRNMANDNGGYLVLFCTPFTGSADVSAQLTWVEHG